MVGESGVGCEAVGNSGLGHYLSWVFGVFDTCEVVVGGGGGGGGEVLVFWNVVCLLLLSLRIHDSTQAVDIDEELCSSGLVVDTEYDVAFLQTGQKYLGRRIPPSTWTCKRFETNRFLSGVDS